MRDTEKCNTSSGSLNHYIRPKMVPYLQLTYLKKVHEFPGLLLWTQWTLSMDSVDSLQWTLSMDSVDSLQWTLSMDSVDIVHGLSGQSTMDIVHGHPGQSPGSGRCPWTKSIESMDILDIVHGLTGLCPV